MSRRRRRNACGKGRVRMRKINVNFPMSQKKRSCPTALVKAKETKLVVILCCLRLSSIAKQSKEVEEKNQS